MAVLGTKQRELASAEIRLADRLRQLRNDKQLTLSELASEAGLSQAYLSRVENHKASLTIASLEQLAAALGVSMAVFFEEDERTLPITICRAGEGLKKRIQGPESFVLEMLAAAKTGKLMEPLIVDLRTARKRMPLKAHAGEEFNFVLSGECVLAYGDNRIKLSTGDSAYYDATVPHASWALRGTTCRVLSIVASRDYLFHGDLTRLLTGAVK